MLTKQGLLGQDNRLVWYDLDLSTKPYKALRYHEHALRAVAFHRSYPLFASSSDDATVHVFHGMVYQVGDAFVPAEAVEALCSKQMYVRTGH